MRAMGRVLLGVTVLFVLSVVGTLGSAGAQTCPTAGHAGIVETCPPGDPGDPGSPQDPTSPTVLASQFASPAAPPPAAQGNLALTGGDVLGLVGIAIAALGLGGGLLIASRRRPA